MSFINLFKAPESPITKEKIEASLREPYDVNSVVTVPAILENERITLVPFVPAVHAQAFWDVFDVNRDIEKYLPITLGSTFEEFLGFLEFLRNRTDIALFAIIVKTNEAQGDRIQPHGKLAGVIGWINAVPAQLSLEVGPVIILPEFQGTFVSANSIGLILKYVLEIPSQGGLGYRRVAWAADPTNAKSIGVAQKMGFQMEGIMRWVWVLPKSKKGMKVTEDRGNGDGRDSALLSLSWEDWVGGVREKVVERMSR